MLKIGQLLDNKYKILSVIGHGGMSVVYMAINEKANKTWAVKEVRNNKKMDFNMVKQGLIAETETLKILNHPHLPSIVDILEEDDNFIIVMDYIEGCSLENIIKEKGVQQEDRVIDWAIQLCDVLGYLHSRNPAIIYRDMKPANVMLKPDGNIMLIDFGTVKNYEIDLGETTGIGTIGFAAPEQYINSGLGRTDARTDIYCLGMTMYQLLTGINPTKQLIKDNSVRTTNPSVSIGLDSIVKKCIEYQPENRYQSCEELMYDLNNFKKLEPIFKKKENKKFRIFAETVIMSVIFAICGTVMSLQAKNKATNTYDTLISDASRNMDYNEKTKLYQKAINVPDKNGDKEAYLGLIQTFKENDSVFSVEESKILEKLINNNKTALRNKQQDYVDVCFETGKLFWYYYNYGDGSNNQLTKAKSSIEWFIDVVNNAPKGYKNFIMAKVYSNIGIFYRDITTNVTEADDRGKYKPLLENFSTLIDQVALDEKESEIVRLELLEMTRSAISQYATKFKIDGVKKKDIEVLFEKIKYALNKFTTTTEKTNGLKKISLSLIKETKEKIDAAYSTKVEGEN